MSRVRVAIQAARESWRYTSPKAVRAREIEAHRREVRAREGVTSLLETVEDRVAKARKLGKNIYVIREILTDILSLDLNDGLKVTDTILGKNEP